MNNKHYIEKFKNVLLVVLVFTTILLLYFLWNNNRSLEDLIFDVNTDSSYDLNIKEILQPLQIAINRGNEDYILVHRSKSQIWLNHILPAFEKFSEQDNIIVEEISKEQYREIFKYPSVSAQFDYDIPFADFCEKLGISTPVGYDSIYSVSQLGFSKGSSESMFLRDSFKDKYYRIVSNNAFDVVTQITELPAASTGVTYFELRSFLGEESTNTALIPVDFDIKIPPLDFSSDFAFFEDSSAVDLMAEPYFGETFNFVRKIEEANGTTIYMYGYGQKVLIVNPSDGSLEYKAEVRNPFSKTESMFDSLDTAMTFINSHGGFKTSDGHLVPLYLSDVSPLGDKRNGYRFRFNMRIDSSEIFYFSGAPLIIEVQNGQISYFKREFIKCTASEIAGEEIQPLSAINMLASNYDYMFKALSGNSPQLLSEQEYTFDYIANKLNSVSIGYLKPKTSQTKDDSRNAENQLVPVWKVKLQDYVFYFGLYDDKPLGYSKEV